MSISEVTASSIQFDPVKPKSTLKSSSHTPVWDSEWKSFYKRNAHGLQVNAADILRACGENLVGRRPSTADKIIRVLQSDNTYHYFFGIVDKEDVRNKEVLRVQYMSEHFAFNECCLAKREDIFDVLTPNTSPKRSLEEVNAEFAEEKAQTESVSIDRKIRFSPLASTDEQRLLKRNIKRLRTIEQLPALIKKISDDCLEDQYHVLVNNHKEKLNQPDTNAELMIMSYRAVQMFKDEMFARGWEIVEHEKTAKE